MKVINAQLVIRWGETSQTDEVLGTIIIPVDRNNGFTSGEVRAAILNMHIDDGTSND